MKAMSIRDKANEINKVANLINEYDNADTTSDKKKAKILKKIMKQNQSIEDK